MDMFRYYFYVLLYMFLDTYLKNYVSFDVEFEVFRKHCHLNAHNVTNYIIILFTNKPNKHIFDPFYLYIVYYLVYKKQAAAPSWFAGVYSLFFYFTDGTMKILKRA